MSGLPRPERRDLAGLALDDITRDELLELWRSTFESERSTVTYGYSLTVLPKLREHPEIAEISNQFDVMISDGRGIFWLANLAGERIREHFSLPDAVELACQLAAETDRRVFLLGATPEINAEAVRRLERRGIAVQGRDGYFAMTELAAIAEQVRIARPDIVLIGITSPKKEQIAAFLRQRLPGCVIIPCGGMIDVMAGLTKREPRLVQKLGVAWLFRWLQEPRRLWKPVLVNGVYAMAWLVPLVLMHKRVLREREFSLLGYFRSAQARTST